MTVAAPVPSRAAFDGVLVRPRAAAVMGVVVQGVGCTWLSVHHRDVRPRGRAECREQEFAPRCPVPGGRGGEVVGIPEPWC